MIKREKYLEVFRKYKDVDLIKIIVGLRRSGKTTFLKSIIEELQDMGVKNENIIYISFETVEHRNVETSKELDEIILEKIENIEGKMYLLFDEIQKVNGWEDSINSYRASFDCDIYVTGSNSKLLSSELATLIAGRYVTINIYPFSFRETLQYHQEINNIELN